MDWFKYEKEASLLGYKTICGIDEAGRGPLAGPVCAAAVVLPVDCIVEGLDDSKKLSEKKREAMFEKIIEAAVSVGIGWASETEIDNINILQATFLAMTRAVKDINLTVDYALVDGNKLPALGIPAKAIVKGDGKVASIAAASIIAKVSRDRLLRKIDAQYPQYGFGRHKGYGTKAHYAAIKQYGILPIHRKSFLKNIDEK